MRDSVPPVADRPRTRRSRPPGGVSVSWSTRAELPAAFSAAWSSRIGRSSLANFTLRLDHVLWEARQGRHATLVLAEEGHRRGAIVLREERDAMVSGWPWRAQAVVEHPETGVAPEYAPGDARWLHEHAERHANGRRLRCFLPCEPPRRIPGYAAGATILQSLLASDEEMLAAMDPNKRRLVRRAAAVGFTIAEATDPEDWRRFAQVQHAATLLREPDRAVEPESDPPDGLGFREWSLPWMWLLVARQGDGLVAGIGDGLVPGGIVEGRAAATTPEGRKVGVMTLLCQEEARRLRDRGHAWLNHGGDTAFKREVAGALGRRIVMWCWLGGGRTWRLPNRTEAWARRVRPRVAAWLRAVAVRAAKKGRSS